MISKALAPTRSLFNGMAPAVVAAAFALAVAPGALHAQTGTAPTATDTAPAATDAAPATTTVVTPATDGTPPAAKPANSAADTASVDGMAPGASATLSLGDGGGGGTASLTETASGVVLFKADLTGLPEGIHAIHIHETGTCEAPDFKSAGGHLAGGKEHGILSAGGPHPGDIPNITASADGTATLEFFMTGISMADVMDNDGSAVVVHAAADDYTSQPAGDAGDRISCGVIEAK